MVEESVLALAASPLVYVALYVLTTIDGFFPPMPSESVVIALAALAVAGDAPHLGLVVAVAALGAFTGDQIAYAIGRRTPVRRLRPLRGRRAQRTLDWAEHALAHRGAAFIIGARYIPIGRVAVNLTAGAVGFPRGRFVGLTALAAVSWAFYSTAIGIGAGAFLSGRPLVAVGVGVVAGTTIGLVVDAVLSRVQGRPRAQRLGVEPTPEVATGPAATAPGQPDPVAPTTPVRRDAEPAPFVVGPLADVLAGDALVREVGPVGAAGAGRPATAAVAVGGREPATSLLPAAESS